MAERARQQFRTIGGPVYFDPRDVVFIGAAFETRERVDDKTEVRYTVRRVHFGGDYTACTYVLDEPFNMERLI